MQTKSRRLCRGSVVLEQILQNGMLLLHDIESAAWVWLPRTPSRFKQLYLSLAFPIKFLGFRMLENSRFSRQSFLGSDSDRRIESVVIGVVGLGGGGGHIAQQLAHVGFSNYNLFDGDDAGRIKSNRLVIATEIDAANATSKVELARRRILSVRRNANVNIFDVAGRKVPNPARVRHSDWVAWMGSRNVANLKLSVVDSLFH